ARLGHRWTLVVFRGVHGAYRGLHGGTRDGRLDLRQLVGRDDIVPPRRAVNQGLQVHGVVRVAVLRGELATVGDEELDVGLGQRVGHALQDTVSRGVALRGVVVHRIVGHQEASFHACVHRGRSSSKGQSPGRCVSPPTGSRPARGSGCVASARGHRPFVKMAPIIANRPFTSGGSVEVTRYVDPKISAHTPSMNAFAFPAGPFQITSAPSTPATTYAFHPPVNSVVCMKLDTHDVAPRTRQHTVRMYASILLMCPSHRTN